MKVVHLINSISRGGAVIMMFNLIKELKANGVNEQIVIGITKENKLELELKKLGVEVRTLGLEKNLTAIKSIIELRSILEKLEPEIIQSWMYHSNIFSSITAPKNSKVIWSIHHSLKDMSNEKLLTKFLIRVAPLLRKKFSKVVYCSTISKEQHDKIGYPRNKSVIIPNGFDVNEFSPDYNKGKEFRKKNNIPLEVTLFGQAARFHPMKNHEGMIKMFRKAVEKKNNLHLVMAGQDINHGNTKLTNLIAEHKMNNMVTLVGECRDMPMFYNSLDFYCSSSISGEAFPMVLGEAMACRIPCIATDIADSSVIIGDSGRIIEVGNTKSYVNAICEFADLTKEEYSKLSSSSRSRIKENFSLSTIGDSYLKVYKQVLKEDFGSKKIVS